MRAGAINHAVIRLRGTSCGLEHVRFSYASSQGISYYQADNTSLEVLGIWMLDIESRIEANDQEISPSDYAGTAAYHEAQNTQRKQRGILRNELTGIINHWIYYSDGVTAS